ncbi:MAG: radical SAM protein [candidate division WOR-3 bacterium]
MSPLPLQKDVIYGPIRSKRLGLSLGINLLPINQKVCSFDCIYCHYGKTNIKTLDPKDIQFPPIDLVLKKLEWYLKSDIEFHYITFSGNGEPLLYPNFDLLVKEIKKLRDRYRPKTPIALLSNSSVIIRDKKIEILKLITLPIFKLDAGDEETFQEINRPVSEVKLNGIVSALKEISKEIEITIQTVFLNGRIRNFNEKSLKIWISLIKEINPSFIQIYSVDRPVAEENVKMVDDRTLLSKAKEIERRTKIRTIAYLPK